MTTEEQGRFENFEQDLLKARDSAYKEINIANEFGLGHQEIKHSEFLAHLLDPNRKPYRLKADQSGSKAYFLRFFFAALEKYSCVGLNKKKRLNSDILACASGNGQAVSAADIEALGSAKDLQADTETRGEDDNKRIDILLISKQEQIVFVIENKVFSKTHDDQLKYYEQRYQGSEWKKKVFVYLTPKGDIPQNKDGTEAVNWCAFDYAALHDVIEEFKNAVAANAATSITELTGKLKNKFIYAMEDYMGNIDTEVLNKASGEANDVYAKLLDKYPDLVEGLARYYNGAHPAKVADYCRKKLHGTQVRNNRAWCYTEEMKKFFERHGEEIGSKFYIVCQQKSGSKTEESGNIMELWAELLISQNASPAQQLIMNDPRIKKLQRGGPLGNTNYNIIRKHPFLTKKEITASDGTYLPFDEVRPKIDEYLQDFSADLQQLKDILKTL